MKIDKIVEVVGNIESNKYLKSISKAMIAALPAIIVGSVFTLLTAIPFGVWKNFLQNTGYLNTISLITKFTTSFTAIVVVFYVARNIATAFHYDGSNVGLLAVITFFLLTPLGSYEVGEKMVSAIPFDYLGSKGMFVGIIVGLLVGRIYAFLMDHKIYIRMPDSVPAFIEKSFANIAPWAIILLGSSIIQLLFTYTSMNSVHEFVYKVIQIPLQSLGGSFPAVLIAYLLIGMFWIFGLHGKALVYSVVMPIWTALAQENLANVQAGLPPTNIINGTFVQMFFEVGGSGCLLSLCIVMLVFAKSQRYKSVGKVTLIPTICQITEPLTFAAPIVMNPLLAIPYLVSPLIGGSIAYICTKIGFLPIIQGASFPTGTPVLVNGFILGSWQAVVIQLIVIAIGIVIYYPFFIKVDRLALKEEMESNREIEAE